MLYCIICNHVDYVYIYILYVWTETSKNTLLMVHFLCERTDPLRWVGKSPTSA